MTNWSLTSQNSALPKHRRFSDRVAFAVALVAIIFVGAFVFVH